MEIELPTWLVKRNNLASRFIEVSAIDRESDKAVLISGVAKIKPTANCCKCGRLLTDAVSQQIGIGPICCGVDQRADMSQEDKDEYVKRFSSENPINIWVPKRYLEGNEWKILLKPELIDQKETSVPIFDINVILYKGVICVKSKFVYADYCRGITGGKWEKEQKFWYYPLSAAQEVVDTFSFVENKKIDEAVLDLCKIGNNIQDIKTRVDLPDIPISFGPTHWEHQKQAFFFCNSLDASALFMDMGTGKSRVVVDLVQNHPEEKKILIICPKKVVNVWPREFRKYSQKQFNFIPLTGSTDEKFAEASLADSLYNSEYIMIVNFDSVWRDVKEVDEFYIDKGTGQKKKKKKKKKVYSKLALWILEQKWDRIVLDESHRGKQYDGQIGEYLPLLHDIAKKRIILTGTPTPHSPLDVVPQYLFLEPKLIGNYWAARNKYAVMGGYMDKQIVGWKNLEDLNRRIYTIAFRVMADDVLDLPERTNQTLTFRLSGEACKWYKRVNDELSLYLSETEKINTEIVLTKILRMQQITSGYLPKEDGSIKVDNGKVELLEDLLEDIAIDKPVVVFCKFQHDLAEIKKIAEKIGRVYGEISGKSVSGLNDQAELKEGVTLCAVQIQAGGTGIDLTRASYGVYFSVGYSLGDYEQSWKRLHRPGQKNHIMFYHLVAEGTIDEVVYESLENTKNLVELVLRRAR
jgi:hypothetical protein